MIRTREVFYPKRGGSILKVHSSRCKSEAKKSTRERYFFTVFAYRVDKKRKKHTFCTVLSKAPTKSYIRTIGNLNVFDKGNI